MAKRVDGNQSAIVAALRHVGASVTPTHEIGHGFPDLCVGWRGRTVLLEVKDPSQPLSKRKLTPAEAQWHARFQGDVAIVETVDEALAAIGFEVAV